MTVRACDRLPLSRPKPRCQRRLGALCIATWQNLMSTFVVEHGFRRWLCDLIMRSREAAAAAGARAPWATREWICAWGLAGSQENHHTRSLSLIPHNIQGTEAVGKGKVLCDAALMRLTSWQRVVQCARPQVFLQPSTSMLVISFFFHPMPATQTGCVLRRASLEASATAPKPSTGCNVGGVGGGDGDQGSRTTGVNEGDLRLPSGDMCASFVFREINESR
jgi:hypothetical protein